MSDMTDLVNGRVGSHWLGEAWARHFSGTYKMVLPVNLDIPHHVIILEDAIVAFYRGRLPRN